MHAICLQISLQSLFRIFPHASCVHIFRDISGKYSKIHKGFSPFSPSSLKKSDGASVAQSLCGIAFTILSLHGIIKAIYTKTKEHAMRSARTAKHIIIGLLLLGILLVGGWYFLYPYSLGSRISASEPLSLSVNITGVTVTGKDTVDTVT